jgi:uracil-DNA glycosylase family 4
LHGEFKEIFGVGRTFPFVLQVWEMDDLFKRSLLNLRKHQAPKTFGEALWNSQLPFKKTAEKKIVITEDYSEKKQIIESLERFAQDQIPAGASLSVNGGEVSVKATTTFTVRGSASQEALIEGLSADPHIAQILMGEKSPNAVKVMFIPEILREWAEVEPELKGGFVNELICAFPLKTAEFFERMISAMKLAPSEVVMYPIDHGDKDLSQEILEIAAFFQPEVIITLGAKATQRLLQGQDRLTVIHGQFFQRSIENLGHFTFVPLFHPSIIETNQNMKKTAWVDMQKIMKHLKKLP